MNELAPPGDVRLSPERFFWALLEVGGPGDRGPERLGYALEPHLPVPLEEVHTVFLPSGPGRVIACAMDRAALADAAAAGPLSLGPSCLPPFLSAEACKPAAINLLTGPFEPAAARRARRRWTLQGVAGAALGAALLLVGVERRVGAAGAHANAAAAAADHVLAEVLPPTAAGRATLPPAARLTAERRRLTQTRVAPEAAGPEAAVGCDALAARLLALWPQGALAQTESLTVTPTAITLLASVPTPPDAQALADALGRLDGWRLEQPQLAAGRVAVRVTIRLKPAASAQGAP